MDAADQELYRNLSIRRHRTLRAAYDFGIAGLVAGTIAHTINGTANPISTGVNTGGFFLAAVIRTGLAHQIQEKHEKLKEQMNKYGILQTQHEHNYPFSWFNPTKVAETHPVFYVKGNGDIVFKKNSRPEYLRYLAQQKKVISVPGIQPWRWRAYLEPPTAPAKVREWARAKLRAAFRPAQQPALVPVGARRRAID